MGGDPHFFNVKKIMVPSIDNVQYVFEWLICPAACYTLSIEGIDY